MAMAEESSTLMTMESHAKKRTAKNEKLCLEDYIHLLHSRQTFHRTMNQLNQVIRIHGFKKIHHAPKKVLVDAVDSLDLVDLLRSTLGEGISPFAVLTVEDVVADLNELNWQECCVTSIQKLCSCDNQSLFPVSSNQNLRIMNHSHSQSKVQKTRRIEEICGLIPEAFKSSLQATKMVPKRKRSNVQALDCAASTVDSVSLASC